jgi:hypothetical protein
MKCLGSQAFPFRNVACLSQVLDPGFDTFHCFMEIELFHVKQKKAGPACLFVVNTKGSYL